MSIMFSSCKWVSQGTAKVGWQVNKYRSLDYLRCVQFVKNQESECSNFKFHYNLQEADPLPCLYSVASRLFLECELRNEALCGLYCIALSYS